ncbi:MAG: FHA domain-containing protein [Anaerolineae bacterium]|nr:FHA domain-containing protein [Anaerolineae bacterium]MCA9889092.1 FHA domain-containing protein [Anaerolineae bacterium]MCB9461333.1 FHA domain-containing protein [Anaerolineaceae bacterium]
MADEENREPDASKEDAIVTGELDIKKKETEYLNLPQDNDPMPERPPRPGTSYLTSSWRLRFIIGNEIKIIPIQDTIVIGRVLDNETSIGFDLTPYGAYHFGVSRKHAVLTLFDGSLYLEDLGSTNGTRINGFQLTPRQKYRLRDADELEFARLRTIIRFEKPS